MTETLSYNDCEAATVLRKLKVNRAATGNHVMSRSLKALAE